MKKGFYSSCITAVMLTLGLFSSVTASADTVVPTVKFAGFNYDHEANLWKNVEQSGAYSTFVYYAPGWATIYSGNEYDGYSFEGSTHTYNLPQATWETWQAQLHFITDEAQMSADKTYDVSCVIKSTVDGYVNVKLSNKADDAFLLEKKFKLSAGVEYTYYAVDVKGWDDVPRVIFDFGGCGDNCVATVSNIVIKDHSVDDGTVLPTNDKPSTDEVMDVHGYNYDHDGNLWRPIDENGSYSARFFYAPGWNQVNDATFKQEGNKYTVGLPRGTTDQWQAQTFITPTELKLTSDINYDFSCILTSTTDIDNVTIKLVDKISAGNFLFEHHVALQAGVPALVKLNDLAGVNGDFEFVFDFGGNPDNTEVTIEQIVVKNHQIEDGSFYGYSYWHSANLWRIVDENYDANLSFYYAPGWNQLPDPENKQINARYVFQLPAAAPDQWQAQCFFNPTLVSLTAEKNYDFSCVLKSNVNISHITAKLQQTDNNDLFLFAETFPLTAGEPYVFYLKDLPGKNIEKAKLLFDFSGNEENCEVSVECIVLKDHAVSDGTLLPGEAKTELDIAYDQYEALCQKILSQLDPDSMSGDEEANLKQYLTEEMEPGEDYPNGTSLYIIGNRSLDIEGLAAETEYLNGLYSAYLNSTMEEGVDLTNMIVNNTMGETGFKGWELTLGINYGDHNANSGTGMDFWPLAESWNTAFDCHQTLTGLPEGLYEVGVYAYYRTGSVEQYNPDAIVPCQLYVNDFFTPVKNIIDDALPEEEAVDQENCRLTCKDGIQDWSVDYMADGYGYIPNGEWSTSYAFRAGRYYQTVYGIVTDGVLTLGIRNTGNPWYEQGVAYWSNFTLRYMDKNIDALNNVVASFEGRAARLAETEQYHYAVLDDQLADLFAKANATDEPEAKYDLVLSINALFNDINKSIEVYADLVSAAETLRETIFDENYGLSYDEATPYFEIYLETLNDAANGVYTDEQAVEKTRELRGLIDQVTGIRGVATSVAQSGMTVYTLSGQPVGHSLAGLKSGIYVVRAAGQARKVCLK